MKNLVVVLSLFLSLTSFAVETVTLSSEEIQILERGEISSSKAVSAGIVGTVLGFGIGHATVGAYNTKGVVFTIGELVGIGAIAGGYTMATMNCWMALFNYDAPECSAGRSLTSVGIAVLVGFKLFETIDIWTYPSSHNSRYQEIKAKQQSAFLRPRVYPIISSTQHGSNYGLGLTVRF